MKQLASLLQVATLLTEATNQRESYNKLASGGNHPTYFMITSRFAYFLTLKMEGTCSSETSVDFQWTTWRCIPGDVTLSVIIFFKINISLLQLSQ
jgi:hypothetical protein